MKRKNKPRSRNLLIVLFAIVGVLLLLLRLMVFVAGHGRHHL